MPSNKTVYTLDLNVNDAIKHYEDLLKTLKTAGGDPKAISDLESSLVKLKSRFGDLKTEAATGFTDSKGLTKFSKGVGDISIKMQQLGTKIKDVASNAENFPNSEFAQAAKEIERINSQFNNLAKTANSDLIKSLGSMGFSKEQAANIAASVHSEEELVAKLEEEKKRRMEASEAAKQGLNIVKQQLSQEYMSKGGKTAIFGIDLISSTIKSEFDDSKGTLQAFEDLAKEHLVNALAKGMDPQNAMEGVVSIAETFETELGEGFTDAIKKALEDATPTIEGVVSNITTKVNASKEGKAYSAASASYQAIGDPGGGLNANATAAASGYGASIEQLNSLMERAAELTASLDAKQQDLTNTQNSLKSGADSANQKIQQQTDTTQQDANAMASAARQSEQLSASFDQMASRIKNLLSIGSIFTMIRKAIKDTYNDVKTLDKSFASIAMVTNYSVNDMWSSYSQYADMASQLGQKTNDIVQASALFYQQGLSTDEALELTTDTMKLATLAGNDFQTATKEMTSAIRGFKMEMDEGGRVTDVYSQLAAHAAASVDDIAQAMARTASIANSAGMSFENTSAFLTQMIETTQESAENIGTSLKTIIARFTELKENVAGTEDSEFDDLEFNKVDKALKSVGVSLKDTSGQFRDLDQVFLELSQKWDTLDRNTQRYVATIAAGSRQQSRFIAMMDNYDRTVELMDLAADAEGKADEQFAKYADTMEYKINQLQTKWEEFRVQLLNSDFFKGVIDSLNSLMDRLKNFNFKKTIPIIPFAIWAAKTFITKFINTAKTAANAASSVGKALSNVITKTLAKNKIAPEFNTKLAQQRMKILMDRLNKQKSTYGDVTVDVLLNMPTQPLEQGKTAIQAFKDSVISLGGTEQEANQRLQEYAVSLGLIENTTQTVAQSDIPRLNAALQEDATAAQQASTEINHYNNNMDQIAARSQMLTSAFQALGSAATMALTGWISGTMSGKEAFDSFIDMMIAWGIQLTVQWAATAIINRTGSEAAGRAVGEGMNAGLASSGIGIFIVVLLTTIGVIFKMLSKHKKDAKSANELAKQMDEAKKSAKEMRDGVKENESTLTTQVKEAKDLKKEYNELANKSHRNSEEEERFKELQKEILEKYPSVVTYHNEVNNELKISNTLWDDIIEKQEQSLNNTKELARMQEIEEIGESYNLKIGRNKDNQNDKTEETRRADALKDIINTSDMTINFYGGGTQELKGLNQKHNIYGGAQDLYDMGGNVDFHGIRGATRSIKDDEGNYENVYMRDKKSIELIDKALDAIDNQELKKRFDEYADYNVYNDISGYEADTLLQLGEWEDIKNALDSYTSSLKENTELEEEANQLLKERNAEYVQSFAKQYKEEHKNASEAEALLAGAAKALTFEKEDMAFSTSDAIQLIYNDNDSGNNWTIGNTGDTARLEYLATSSDLNTIRYGEGDNEVITLTDKEIYDRFLDMYGGDVAKATEAWANMDEAARSAQIITDEVYRRKLEEANKAAEALQAQQANDAYLEELLNKVLNGSKQEDINNFMDYVSEKGYAIDTEGLLKIYQEARDDFNAGLQEYGFTMSFKDLDAGLGNAMIAHLDEQVAKGVDKESIRRYYSQLLSGLSTEAQEDMIHMLNVTDFSDISLGNITEQKNKWIQEFKAMKEERGEIISQEEAEEEWDKFFKIGQSKGAIDISINSISGLQDIEDNITEFVAEITDSASNLSSILSNYSEDGYIDFSSYKKLEEELDKVGLSIEDYTKATEEGFSVDVNKLEEAYLNQINSKDYLIEQTKEAIKQGIEELDNEISLLEALSGQRDINADLVKQEMERNKLSASTAKNALLAAGQYELAKQISASTIDESVIGNFTDNSGLKALKERKQELEDILNDDEKLAEYVGGAEVNAAYKEVERTFADLKPAAQDVTKAQEDYNKALEDYNNQLETVAEKQEALNEKLETYNDLLYGSDNRKSTLDYLYNYDEAIKSFNDQISRSQDILKDASSIEEATAALQGYATATHNLIAEETAKQQVLQAGLANYANQIENGSYSYTNQETGETTNVNFGDYVRKDDRTGKYVIDQRLINESRFGDDWKDLLETQVSNYNKYSEELLASEDNVRKAEKALRDERENALKNYVALEDKVKEVLKAEYQEQVDNLTDMYDSMKEADDDYVNALQDAIDKQRALRERENAWEDLAKKEKKLSLMQRDTSGVNQVETMKLEEEVQDDREKLLDDAIDDVIEGLSDLYESQSELRDAELELKEALLENDSYWAGLSEATVQGFTDLDDATEWYLQHSLELTDMTAAGAEADILGFQDTYSTATEYMAMQLMDETSETGDFINDAINVTGEEAMEIIEETSETFTTEAQRAFDETQATFEADMEKAEQDIRDAKDALQEAVDKLGELAAAANAAAEAYAAAKRAKDELEGNDSDDDTPTPSPTNSASSTHRGLFDWVDLAHTLNGMTYDINNNGSVDSGSFSIGPNSSFTHAQLANYVQKLYQGRETDELKRIAGVMSLSTTKDNGSTPLDSGELYQKIKERMIASDSSLSSVFKFEEGGLVDFTGPAWVDGTFSKPEAFLSAEDTERIGNAAKILADIPWIDRDTDNSTVVTNNGGDVSVEINLNIDHISSDTDIDDMIERVKEEIVEVARPTGTNVILQQQL